MEFWRYYRVIRRRRWLIVLGTLVAVIAVSYWNYRTPKMYVARTTVMESRGMSQEGIPLFQSQMMGGTLDLQLRLSNLGNIAISQRVLNSAAQTLADLGMKYTPEEILSATSVTPVRDTNILAVEVTLPDAKSAKVAADVVAAEFKKVYADLNNAAVTQSKEFIQAQIETTRQSMVKAQNALKNYKQEHGIVQIDSQLQAEVQKLVQAQTAANQARIAHEAAAARAIQAEKEAKSQSAWQVASKTVARDPIWERLHEQLVDLQSRRADLISRGKGSKHPDLLAVEGQIKDVTNQLTKVKDQYLANISEARNPNAQSAIGTWLQAKVENVAADAQNVASQRVVEDMKAGLGKLPEEEAKVAELQVDLKAATDTYGLMRSKLDEAKIREQQDKNEVALNTIDTAYVRVLDQKKSLKLVLALILAPLLGVGTALLLHYTDNTVKTAAEAEKLLGLPVLSAVPGSKAHSLPRQKCPEVMDVAYQMLTSSLWIANQNQGVNSIVMVSAEPDAGRSVTASNLAVSLAKEGAKVILVDADLRKPTQHLIFGVDNKIGLTNVLSGGATLEDSLALTKVQGLLLVPAGPDSGNPVKLLRSAEMKEFVEQIRELADFVIFDTPAGVTFPDPILVASNVGNAVVVHSAGRVPRGSESEFRARLESVGVRLLGVVLNKVRREDSSSYFHYHRSYEGVGMPQLASGKKAIKGGPYGKA